jgi:adenylate kinase family enzyme
MKNEIPLLGPVRTGKSTLGGLLAQQLGLPQVCLDEIRMRYYEEIGYDAALARTICQQGGFVALMPYTIYLANAVRRSPAVRRGQ